MNKRTLFGESKSGKYKVWSIWVEGGSFFIEHGQEDGKLQIKETECNPKNIGKANETTAEQQALNESESRYKKQIDKGYRVAKGELGEALQSLPMLAHDYLKHGHRIKYPCWVSEKLDGVRCLATRHADRIELRSRGGKLYSVEHIERDLFASMQEGEVWDGEIYCENKFLEEIVSAVKKPNENTPSLEFRIFDQVSDGNFEERIQLLEDRPLHGSSLSLLKYVLAKDEESMKTLHKVYVEEGYEGIIIRNFNGLYESGKRSADLQKYKTFFDDEFVIIGVFRDKNGNSVFELYDNVAGRNFNCTYGNFEQRKHQLSHPDEYIGKYLTVKYQTRYKDSKLVQFPTGVIIRDGEVIDETFIPTT